MTSPTPLTVLNADQFESRPPPIIRADDIIAQLPAMRMNSGPNQVQRNAGSISTVRNLGSERTLILVNGRRSVGSTITGLVDINTIPQALISSVEVVSGGASAAYGSDAVAGVVNFMLNNKYEGLKIEADSGITR